MAHFKRKRARTARSSRYSSNGLKYRLGDRYDDRMWIGGWPRQHDILFHTRPTRRKKQRLEKKVLRGSDTEDMVWPDGRKPHVYYW